MSSAENTAAKAIDNLKNALEKVKQPADDMGNSLEESSKNGLKALEDLASTALYAKISDKMLDIAKAAYELADAFSEARKTIITATGATGEALDGFEQSMMKAYSGNSQDLNTVAGAIGEINTRMGLTGTELEAVTDKFLDYSRITGTNVVGSVQSVTKAMNQWGVDMGDVESMLDRLTYAGQVSGISVDNLTSTLYNSASMFKEVGLDLDSTVQMLSDFELAGINSSTAVTGFRTAIKYFTDAGLDANVALRETITEIGSMGDSSRATAEAIKIFGNKAGVQLADAIRSGTISVETFNADLTDAEGTLKNTAAASETLSEKWNTAANKIKTAFTQAVAPAVENVSSKLAGVVDGFGQILIDTPALTSGLAGAAAGFTAVVGVVSAATAAVKLFGMVSSTLSVSSGPLFAIIGAVTALGAAVGVLINQFGTAEKQVEDYNGTLEQCANEIERTEDQYRNVCALYGENSSAAKSLEASLDTLHAQYAKGGGAVADYAQRVEESAKAIGEFKKNYQDQMDAIDNTEMAGQIAVAQLKAISDKAVKTNFDLNLMTSYAEKLNNEYHCNIVVDYNTGDITGLDPVEDFIQKQNGSSRKQAAIETMTDEEAAMDYAKAIRDRQDALKEIKIIEDEMAKMNASPGYVHVDSKTNSTKVVLPGENKAPDMPDPTKSYQQYEEELAKYRTALNEADSSMREYEDTFTNMGLTAGYTLDEVEEKLGNLKINYEELTSTANEANDSMTPNDVAVQAFSNYQSEIEQLADAYAKSCESVRSNLDSMFGLFTEAPDLTSWETLKDSLSMDDATANIQSQIDYFNQYKDAVDQLSDLGVDNNVISQLDPAQAVAFANELSSMDTETAKGKIKDLNNTFKELSDVKDDLSKDLADIETQFSEKMADIESKMQKDVEKICSDMEFAPEARNAAHKTLSSYAEQIRKSGEAAVDTAQDIANRVSAALSSASGKIDVGVNETGPSVKSVKGNASGTTNAEDIFIAGEEGPELIVGKAGSTVFPASETNRIIDAVSGISDNPGINNLTTNNNNSYTTARNIMEYSTFNNSENTEIVNNYHAARADYDDTKIIQSLGRIESAFASIENDISAIDTDNADPETGMVNTYVPVMPEIVVDFSVLENLISEMDYGDHISSHSENVTYGDTYTADNSWNYNTEYGDTINNSSNYYSSQITAVDLTLLDNIVSCLKNIEIPAERETVYYPETDEKPIAAGKSMFDSTSTTVTENRSITDSRSEHKIIIEVTGKDGLVSHKESDGYDKKQMVKILLDNLEPALMGILETEKFEEGDQSYEI